MAPNSGVLVPELNYQSYKVKEKLSDFYTDGIKTNAQAYETPERQAGNGLLWFLVGLTAGVVAGVSIHH